MVQGVGATRARKRKRKPKAPRSPTMLWRNKKDRARTKHPDVMRRFAQSAVNEVWRRIPLCIRLIIAHFAIPNVRLVNVDCPEVEAEELDQGFTDVEGRAGHDSTLVTLNVAYFKATKTDRPRMVWVLAHEYAHIYLGQMMWLAWEGFMREGRSRKGVGHRSPSRLAALDDDAVAEAIRCHERKLPKKKGPRLDECMADRIAEAWRFGFEHDLYLDENLRTEFADWDSRGRPRTW